MKKQPVLTEEELEQLREQKKFEREEKIKWMPIVLQWTAFGLHFITFAGLMIAITILWIILVFSLNPNGDIDFMKKSFEEIKTFLSGALVCKGLDFFMKKTRLKY